MNVTNVGVTVSATISSQDALTWTLKCEFNEFFLASVTGHSTFRVELLMRLFHDSLDYECQNLLWFWSFNPFK